MKELVAHMAKCLVDDVEAVKVEMTEGNETVVIELSVAKGDLGKVIGKQGRNAEAMRTILVAYASKLKKRAVLEILE